MGQKPDTATARDNGGGGNFEAHPEGQYAVVCVDVVNLGWKIEQYMDNPPHEVEKAALVFASGARNTDNSLQIITVEMTLSMGERANMRKFLQSWRGKSYTPEQAAEGVPLDKLHGHPGLVSIEHVTTKAGRKFAKVGTIGPLPKVMPAPPKALLEEYERPKYFETRKAEYAAGVASHRAQVGAPPAGSMDDLPPQLDDDDDSDLPF